MYAESVIRDLSLKMKNKNNEALMIIIKSLLAHIQHIFNDSKSHRLEAPSIVFAFKFPLAFHIP